MPRVVVSLECVYLCRDSDWKGVRKGFFDHCQEEGKIVILMRCKQPQHTRERKTQHFFHFVFTFHSSIHPSFIYSFYPSLPSFLPASVGVNMYDLILCSLQYFLLRIHHLLFATLSAFHFFSLFLPHFYILLLVFPSYLLSVHNRASRKNNYFYNLSFSICLSLLLLIFPLFLKF